MIHRAVACYPEICGVSNQGSAPGGARRIGHVFIVEVADA